MSSSAPPEIDLTVYGVIAVALALCALAVWWWRARGGAAMGGAIRLLALRPLGGKRMVALIEIEDERFLLGLTDSRVSCLGRLPATRDAPLEANDGDAG